MSVRDIMKTSMQNFANEAYKRFEEKGAVKDYSLTKAVSADAGYAATYQLTKDGVAVGDKINIPKDYLVKSASVETVAAADTPVAGYTVGQKYLDFVVNTYENDETATHIYLLVQDLVDVYSGDGRGIVLGANNVFSIQIDSANANGLSVGNDGLAMGLASRSANGALASTDFASFAAKQEQIVVGTATGDGNAITAISLNADDKTIDLVKGATFVQTSDIVELTAAECVTIFNTAQTAYQQSQSQGSGD